MLVENDKISNVDLVRPLGFTERVFALRVPGKSKRAWRNHVISLSISSDLSQLIVQKAINHVVEMHPMLQMALDYSESESRPSFKRCLKKSKVVASFRPWSEVYEEGMNGEEFAEGQPLYQLHLCYEKNERTGCVAKTNIVLRLHHAIEDGVSSLVLVNDLLSVIDQLISHGKLTEVSKKLLPLKIESALPKRPSLYSVFRLALSAIRDQLKPAPWLVVNQEHKTWQQRNSVCLQRKCDVAPLKAWCEQHQVTVHHMLSAAMILSAQAMLKSASSKKVAIKHGQNVDLRPFAKGALSNDLLCAVGLSSGLYTSGQINDLLSTAKQVKERLSGSIASGEHLGAAWIDHIYLNAKRAFVAAEDGQYAGREGTTFLSNLGRYSFTTKFNNVSLESLYFSGAQHLTGWLFWLGVITIDDSMYLNFTFVDGVVEKGQAEEFVRYFMGFLPS